VRFTWRFFLSPPGAVFSSLAMTFFDFHLPAIFCFDLLCAELDGPEFLLDSFSIGLVAGEHPPSGGWLVVSILFVFSFCSKVAAAVFFSDCFPFLF